MTIRNYRDDRERLDELESNAPLVPEIERASTEDSAEDLRTELSELRAQLDRIERTLGGEGK